MSAIFIQGGIFSRIRHFNQGLACCHHGCTAVAAPSSSSAAAAVCLAGTGGMFFCEAECVPGTYNNGKHQCCQKCSSGLTSGFKATNCTQPQTKGVAALQHTAPCMLSAS
jgi:hypothetical protein